MEIRFMHPGEETSVIQLVQKTFDQCVAPGFTEEGISQFYKYASTEALSQRSKEESFTIIAKEKNQIVGIIEIKDQNHVSMFFVSTELQGKGVGKKLFHEAITHIKKQNPQVKELTVNSSPNAVEAYRKLGFIPRSEEQCADGIRFVPMKLSLESSPTK